MAVYTTITITDVQPLAARLGLGSLRDLRGIPSGIENTNYFLISDRGEFVLTLFERLSAAQLPFYLHLMKHLAGKGIPVPCPIADSHGEILHSLAGKPAAVVNKLAGEPQLAPTAMHCKQVGEMLARMHQAGRDFPMSQPNLRGLPWMVETVRQVVPHLQPSQRELLERELAYHQANDYSQLPRGPIHADLFRDNAMFNGELLTGFFDFYFAGVDAFLFDMAVTLNDWCINLASGRFDEPRRVAFLNAYSNIRKLTLLEEEHFQDMLRLAALRFWLSRLWDWYLPRAATLLKPHDPAHFERILRDRAGG